MLGRTPHAGTISPRVGGHRIFRDGIYGRMRIAFQADYRYYGEPGLLDFPQGDFSTRLFNAVIVPLTRIPAFRIKLFDDMKQHMVRPFEQVLREA